MFLVAVIGNKLFINNQLKPNTHFINNQSLLYVYIYIYIS